MQIEFEDLISFYASNTRSKTAAQQPQQPINKANSSKTVRTNSVIRNPAVHSQKKPQNKVQIVEFNDSGLRQNKSNNGKSDRRKFMSASIKDIQQSLVNTPQDKTSTMKATRQDNKDDSDNEELENLKLDKELHRLVNMELEQVSLKHMHGKDRRKFMDQKLHALGLVKQEKCKVPQGLMQRMLKKSKQRAEKQQALIKQAGDDGLHFASSTTGRQVTVKNPGSKSSSLSSSSLVLTSSSHPLAQTVRNNTKRQKTKQLLGIKNTRSSSERGLKSGMGKYVKGVLKVDPKLFKK
ncbi:hypothetical protein MP228_009298 [Amoeboaphelidium protococcarum]|nr:hypothetical protein MP228_009298 [Amoeboaphelidium protococcarum]